MGLQQILLRVFVICFATINVMAVAEEAEIRGVVVCSTTQIADFTRQIVGDSWEVRCVLAPGQDPHLYRVTGNDLQNVRDADLCIENGWHLEGASWMQNLAKDAGKPLVSCIEGVQPILLPTDQGNIEVQDPHAWFSPLNAVVYVRNILNGIVKLDPENADEYRSRAELYVSQLRGLHTWIQKQCNSIPPKQRVLVTSHDAFNYFCKTYKFKSAAPVGWSTGQEIGSDITFDRRQKAIASVRDLGVKAVFVETSVNQKVIKEMAKEAGVKVGGELYSDSMGKSGSAGETYLGMMRENVITIVEALR